jgi:hypothetical protein
MHKEKSWLDSIKKEADRRPLLTLFVVPIVCFAVLMTIGTILKNADPTCTLIQTDACTLNAPMGI